MSSKEPHIISGLTALATEDYHALLRERDELRAEVESLNLLLHNNQVRREEVEARHGDLLRQVERLRAARDACEQQFQEKVARINELDAEIERLRGECDKLIAHIEQLEQR